MEKFSPKWFCRFYLIIHIEKWWRRWKSFLDPSYLPLPATIAARRKQCQTSSLFGLDHEFYKRCIPPSATKNANRVRALCGPGN